MSRFRVAVLVLAGCSSGGKSPPSHPAFVHLFGGAELAGALGARTASGDVFTCSSPSDDTPYAPCDYRADGFTTATTITVANSHQYCAALADGAEHCLNCPAFGRYCDPQSATTPVSAGVISVSGACSVLVDGSVVCWDGSAIVPPGPVSTLKCGYLLLTDGSLFDPNATQIILASVVDVSCTVTTDRSLMTWCAVTSDNALYCWGSNAAGRLGDGTDIDRALPTKIGDGFTQVAVDLTTAAIAECGVKADGTLWCWGEGSASSDLRPVQMRDIANCREIAAARDGFYVLRSDGSLAHVAPGSPPNIRVGY
jgi:hypothetical protein